MRGRKGGGPHGHIIDGYELRCEAEGATHAVHMDMYHGEGDRERRPVAPFTVLAEHPARLAEGCPPRVVAHADSSAHYVFIWWEVEKPGRPPRRTASSSGLAPTCSPRCDLSPPSIERGAVCGSFPDSGSPSHCSEPPLERGGIRVSRTSAVQREP